jgi:hypothetical protein
MDQAMTNHTQERRAARTAAAVLATLALVATACSHGTTKRSTWADRLPTSDCQPRTRQAQIKLGGCPKLADVQRPTPAEVCEFVNYMNRKQGIEGTLVPEGLDGPGCLQWRVNPSTGRPERYGTGRKQGCVSVEDAINNFKLP